MERHYLKFGNKKMSKIGKQIINIPSGTTVTLTGGILKVKGPKGELSRPVRSEVVFNVASDNITLAPGNSEISTKALWGTYSSILKSMVAGVNTPFEKKLMIEGVGFKVEVVGKELVMALGFSHPVKIKIPDTLKVVVEKGSMTITGINKEEVGEFSAFIRAKKKPEPYKGKGIRYSDEVVRRKQGKKTA